MEKPDNNLHSRPSETTGNNQYPFDLHQHHQQPQLPHPLMDDEGSSKENSVAVNFMNSINVLQPQQQQFCASFYHNNSLDDRFSFADVMRFADGPTLGINQGKAISEGEKGIDQSSYFVKFPVLNEKIMDDHQTLMASFAGGMDLESCKKGKNAMEEEQEEGGGRMDNPPSSVPHRFVGENVEKSLEVKNKRKRPRSVKSSEEVESQRMTHIAVERNRRKQMNEHLRVLRSLMPGSYVQRGDQASIIGGAIEFVRELEQLLQCLESQKRRRLFGENESQNQIGESSSSLSLMQTAEHQPPAASFFPPLEGGLLPDTAESKSCLADVEVKVMGCDAMIKILSTRRMGQLIKTIAALQDLQLNIVHTNVTTIDQTVLYSFNVKVACESTVTADDIARSVQQILSYIHANSGI